MMDFFRDGKEKDTTITEASSGELEEALDEFDDDEFADDFDELDDRFDELAKGLAQKVSRRQVLRLASAAVLGVSLFGSLGDAAEASTTATNCRR